MSTAATPAATKRLVCSTLRTLASRLPVNTRIAALDVSPTHLSVALSDSALTSAHPFGVLRRGANARTDSKILTSVFDRLDFSISALLIGTPPHGPPTDYVNELLSNSALLPDTNSLLYYSEPAAVVHAVQGAYDVRNAAKLLANRKESRKRHRFAAAMFPDLNPASLDLPQSARARISATDILQAVLDEFAQLPQVPE